MTLLQALIDQKQSAMRGGIYHRTQIDLAYNSNHIEGSRLSHDQTRSIYETNTVGLAEGQQALNVDDIIETTNHFRAFDYIIDNARRPLTAQMLKDLHRILKTGTSDAAKSWFAVGDYKRLPNEVGGLETTAPEDVPSAVNDLLDQYNSLASKSLDDILDLHQRFESIHPFQDGNGRVGRLVMFKECLANEIVPFIITDELKMFYYRGLREWPDIPGYLRDTCLTAQDSYRAVLQRLRITC